jgi:MFS family permease
MCPHRLRRLILANDETFPLTETSKSGFFYGYVIVAIAFLVLLVVGGVQYTFGVFFRPLASEFGWTSAATSGAFSTYMVLSGISTVIAGRLNDRFGPRVVLTISSFFLGAGLILMSQASAIWHLYLFYGALVSIGMAGTYFPLISTVVRWFVKKRGMMTGVAASGVGVGTMIFPPFASWLISSHGWSASYIVMGIIGWVIFIVGAQFMRRDPAQKRQLPYGHDDVPTGSTGLKVEGFSTGEAMRTVPFWLFCIVYFLFGVFLQGLMIHIVPHAIYSGISAITAATLLTTLGGLSIVGRIFIGSAGDRIGNKAVFVAGFILTTVALACLLVTEKIWMFYLVAVIFGFAYGGLAILHSPLVADLFGLKSHSTILGIIGFVIILGGAAGSFMAGWMFDITGSYISAFVIFGIISVISLILASFLKPAMGGTKNES